MAFLGTLMGSATDAYTGTMKMQDDLANSADNRRIKDDNHAMDMQERGLNYEKEQDQWTTLSQIATQYQKQQEDKQKEMSGNQQQQQPQPQSLQNGPPAGISPSGQVTSGVGNSQQQPQPAQPFLQNQQAKPIPEIVKGMAQSVGGQSNGQADGPPAEQERQQASQGVPPNPKPYLASIKPDAAPTDPNSPIFQQVADVAARKADGVVPQEQTAAYYQNKAQRDMKEAEQWQSNAKAMMKHPKMAKDFSDQAKDYEKQAQQATLQASKITSDNAAATNKLASSITDNPKSAPILLNKFREEHRGAYQQLVSQKDPKTGLPLFPAYDDQGNRRASEAGLEYLKAVAPESLTVKDRADIAGRTITRQIAAAAEERKERHDQRAEIQRDQEISLKRENARLSRQERQDRMGDRRDESAVKKTDVVQKQIAKEPLVKNYDNYKNTYGIASSLADKIAKDGLQGISSADALDLKSNYQRMLQDYKSTMGSSKQSSMEINALNSNLAKVDKWIGSFGRGTPAVGEGSSAEILKTVQQDYYRINKEVVAQSLQYAESAEKRGGNPSMLVLKGDLQAVVDSGQAAIKTDPESGDRILQFKDDKSKRKYTIPQGAFQ